MCGIAGIIALEPERFMRSMLSTIEHRGRDDEGIWTSEPVDERSRQVCLGHRRLAIIDTSSAGHQPMHYADGRFVITFNGEIYNYRELREDLKSKGHQFHTDTDTEVLLAAFAEWGADCMPHLNGMFAFAVWDNRERTLTLARDHVGIKPLYYAQLPAKNGHGPVFIFASEVKALLATGLLERGLDLEALHQFLTFLWVPDPNTLFKGIKTLPPAHTLILRGDEIAVSEWWDVAFDQIEEGRSETWWQERILETLDQVVQMEMVADVPLGSFLSGGIDST
ncbi:MAG TPA: asparagine synthase (glutamine-hydrolyzing), partial [Pyrinomonadaceae bacterium]|nr:asparagine synthase (glutamine-hydrolyzing) [Pyrinomonadaceae bacterium]